MRPKPHHQHHQKTPKQTSTRPGTKVRKLTEFFDKLGGDPSKKKTPVKKENGSITKRKRKHKIEEPQRAKMETALKKYLLTTK